MRDLKRDLHSSDEVHVWRLELKPTAAELQKYFADLSGAEQEQAGRFHFEADRNRFLASHGILRSILARYLSCTPVAVHFEHGPNGKPRLANPGAEWLKFNISHSHERGLVAVAAVKEVGIDIEFTRRLRDLPGLSETIFSKEDFEAFTAIPPDLQDSALYASWVRKEAYLKMLGTGLSRDPKSVSTPFVPDTEIIGLKDALSPYQGASCWVHPVSVAQDYVAALAIEPRSEASTENIVLYDWPSA